MIRAPRFEEAARLARFRSSVDSRLAEEGFRHALRERVPAGDLFLLVAERAGALVGFARASRVLRPTPSVPSDVPSGWYLLGIHVDAPHRRRGLGAALTERRLSWLEPRTDTVYLTVMADNVASLRLHAGHGFVEIARGVNAPGRAPHPDRILFSRRGAVR